jgi:hypothetical protein
MEFIQILSPAKDLLRFYLVSTGSRAGSRATLFVIVKVGELFPRAPAWLSPSSPAIARSLVPDP